MAAKTDDIGWVFFDVGGTLIDERIAQLDHAEQLRAVLCEQDRRFCELSITDLLTHYEYAVAARAENLLAGALRRLSVDASTYDRISCRVQFRRQLERPYPAAKTTLAQLSRMGYMIGIIANQPADLAKRLVRYELSPYIGMTIASGEIGVAKPAPEIFLAALEKAACAPHRCMMIGDRLDHDIAPAKQLGMLTIRVSTGLYRCQEPISPEEVPDWTVSSLSEVIRLLT